MKRGLYHFLGTGLLALAWPLAYSVSSTAAQAPLVGAIRWDAWVGDKGAPAFQHGLWNEAALSDPKFHDRVPFYGCIQEGGKVEARCVTQATLDAEIAYAKGTLDYWAFLAYPPWASDGPMNTALALYLSSTHKAEVNFCVILNGRQWWDHLDTYVGYFKEPCYQRVLGNRPLVYLFSVEKLLRQPLGSWPNGRQALARLTAASVAAGLGEPYYVIMDFKPEQAANNLKELNAHAISSYCLHGDGLGAPYQALAASTEKKWDAFKATGKPVVPVCMAGWDPRPRIAHPVYDKWASHYGKGYWYQMGSPAEVAAHIGQALKWNAENPQAAEINTVIVYNWNEFTEGGWLCPTLKSGDDRLRAIRKLRQRAGNAIDSKSNRKP